MTDEFLTKGLENDRYVKARQLVKQFEKELEVELRAIGQEMVDRNRNLFAEGVDGSESSSTKSNSLPYARLDYRMARIQSPENNDCLKLNIHLYWDDPREYNRQDIDGALAALGYKIKNISETDEQRVVAETRDWTVQTSENRFSGKIAFYNHVNSAEELKETGERLVEQIGRAHV